MAAVVLPQVPLPSLWRAKSKPGEDAGPYESLAAAHEAGAVTLNYGLFFNTILTFLLVAFAVFMMVKMINRWKREDEEPEAEPTTKECEYCKTQIPLEAMRCPACTSQIE